MNNIIYGAVKEIAEKELLHYAQQQSLRELLNFKQLPCPCCGGKMRDGGLVLNAMSRFAPIYICPECGVNEAMNGTHLVDWYAIRNRVSRKNAKQFAASGSAFAPELDIYGKASGTTFTSDEFTGTMDSRKFWDDLADFAKKHDAFVRLMY